MSKEIERAVIAACLLSAGTAAHALGNAVGHCNKAYEVTITNMTYAQVLSPPLAATHVPSRHLYAVGEPAGEGLAVLAEGGDTSVLTGELEDDPGVCDVQTAADVVPPGASISVIVRGSDRTVLSVATMLVNTNDGFAAADGMPLPRPRGETLRIVPAYDAGSEENDESCLHVPGPACGG